MHTCYTIHNNHKIWGAHDLLSRPEVISDPQDPARRQAASRHSAPLEPEGIYFQDLQAHICKISNILSLWDCNPIW